MDDFLILDRRIRDNVLLPIVLISFVSCAFRHYLNRLVYNDSKQLNPETLESFFILQRSKALRTNSKYIGKDSFLMRQYYLIGVNKALLRTWRNTSPMPIPGNLFHTMVQNSVNIVVMISLAEVINNMFSGFVATRLPFPITSTFKKMLQSGINLTQLNPTWVSSLSWYFLNVFGISSVLDIIIQKRGQIYDIMQYPNIPDNPTDLFKQELEELQLCDHESFSRGIDLG